MPKKRPLSDLLPTFPDPSLGLAIRRDTNNGKEIEVCVTRTATGWVPHMRLRKTMNDGANEPWQVPSLAYPKGGFLDMEVAYAEALSAGVDASYGLVRDVPE